MATLQRITIPTPNPELAKLLKSSRMAAEVDRITSTIAAVYEASLPVRTGNLKRGVYHYIALGSWGGGVADRWFGYVGNRALSYRGTKGVPYGGVIEYGQGSRKGQGQLSQAAVAVLGNHAHVSSTLRRSSYRPGPTPRSYGDRNPQTGLAQFRNRKGQFVSSPDTSKD